MSNLGSHLNVYNTCLNLLRRNGFELSMYRDNHAVEIQDCMWVAEKNGYEFVADNPIELLGLATIYENINPPEDKPYWWQIEDQDIYQELIDKTYPESLEN